MDCVDDSSLRRRGRIRADAVGITVTLTSRDNPTAALIADLDGDRAGLLRRLYTDSDRCFMFYDAIVMRSKDEAVMLRAQHLTRSAMGRLDLLRELMRHEVVA